MKVKQLALYALVMAVYVAVTMALMNFSFGPIQVRIAEVLVIMAIVRKDMILPLTLACLITNLLGVMSGADIIGFWDVIFGTLASFVSLLTAYYFRGYKFKGIPLLSLCMPAIFNGLIVGAMLAYVIMPQQFLLGWLINGLEVALGEMIACVGLGIFLYRPLEGFLKSLVL